MALENVSLGNCVFFALVLTGVTSWTIDLPEVRKYFFERNAAEKKLESRHKNEDYETRVYYNNIEGNSKHNSEHYEDVYENTAYAREYGYQSYMEKKVNGIVYNGSVYLEGLRKSLENYTEYLENCTRMISFNQSSIQVNSTWQPPMESSLLNATMMMERCRNLTRASEHVRRLAALALWTTGELQDIAYSKKYDKDDPYKLSMEENELILKLAWFLDRIAHHTGYEPEPTDFLREDTTTTSPTTVTAASMVNPSDEVKRLMMECLQQNSSEPAVDRCRYPEPLPPLVQAMINMNENASTMPTIPVPTSTNPIEQVVPLPSESRSVPSMELLITADNRTPMSNLPPTYEFPPSLTAVKNIKKRSVLSMTQPEVSKNAPKLKRTEDNPALNFLKYYAKHKIWEGSNNVQALLGMYEVKNRLTAHSIKKRAFGEKKIHFRLPENPFQDLSKYVKHKPGVNYIKDVAQAEKIKAAFEKIKNNKPSSKEMLRKLTKLLRLKRSVIYEKDIDLPRESVEPQKDISFYIKNKPGRNFNNDLTQAVRVRAGLEQIFNTGNIEVVRRFGANYNPLIPAPIFAGVLKTMADF